MLESLIGIIHPSLASDDRRERVCDQIDTFLTGFVLEGGNSIPEDYLDPSKLRGMLETSIGLGFYSQIGNLIANLPQQSLLRIPGDVLCEVVKFMDRNPKQIAQMLIEMTFSDRYSKRDNEPMNSREEKLLTLKAMGMIAPLRASLVRFKEVDPEKYASYVEELAKRFDAGAKPSPILWL